MNYCNKHQDVTTCECPRWENARDPVRKEPRKADCASLKCDATQLERRQLESRPEFRDEPKDPLFNFGAIASGDRVEKSGMDRDKYVKCFEVIAFEIEGVRAWNKLPCLVVKAVFHYADSS